VVRRPAADVRSLTIAALSRGGQFLPHPLFPDAPQVVYWDLADKAWCRSPVFIRMQGEGHFVRSLERVWVPFTPGYWNVHDRMWNRGDMFPAGAEGGPFAQYEPSRALVLRVPCKTCPACKRWRRFVWAGYAEREWEQSVRTWMLTLTFGPAERYRIESAIRLRLAAEGVSFDALPEMERFRERKRELRKWLDWFFMRMRVGNKKIGRPPLRFRYLLSWEPHPASGFPHVHVLLHETQHHPGVGRREIENVWRTMTDKGVLGFAKAKLVKDAVQARYVCKYIGKLDNDRVRASLGYGRRDVPALMARCLGGGLGQALASLAEEGPGERATVPARPGEGESPEASAAERAKAETGSPHSSARNVTTSPPNDAITDPMGWPYPPSSYGDCPVVIPWWHDSG
jgi:hypothetical protein